ncbi:MAG: hypothetical protein HXK63_05960 [Campylobacter sp.]|nr:hypothetical protein [Campylobacter sp.]
MRYERGSVPPRARAGLWGLFVRQSGAVLSQTSSVLNRLKASKLTRFLILLSSRTEPQPNSRGENLNLRYNLAKRSVELLLRVRDEI